MTTFLICCFTVFYSGAVAKPTPAPGKPQASTTTPPAGTDTRGRGVPVPSDRAEKKCALILCGHPGTPAYAKAYRDRAAKLQNALVNRWGFSRKWVWVRCNALERTSKDRNHVSEPFPCRGPATAKAIGADVAKLRAVLTDDDILWVIVISHAHFDGRDVWLNLPGPDVNQRDFAGLFNNIKSRSQVFVISSPASGFFISRLSAKRRIIMTATQAGAERNETRFSKHLANVLDAPPPLSQLDRDRDGRISVLDLYLTVVRRVMASYHDAELLPTEHALLDDNGDGVGTELQRDDLEPSLGGRVNRRPIPVVIRPPGDGTLAASLVLSPGTGAPHDRSPVP